MQTVVFISLSLLCNAIIELIFKNYYPQIVILQNKLATQFTTYSEELIPADSSFQKSARCSVY